MDPVWSPEIVIELEYRQYKSSDSGEQLYIQPKSATGARNFYHAVKRISRTYSDMQAEKANRLSILPNYRAWCRLIYDHKSRGIENEDPSLKQYHIKTLKRISKELAAERNDMKKQKMAQRIRKQSKKLGKPRGLVDREIEARSPDKFLNVEAQTEEKRRKPNSPKPETGSSGNGYDEVVIMVAPGRLELDAITCMQEHVALVRDEVLMQSAALVVRGILLTQADPCTVTRDTFAHLQSLYPGVVLKTIIPKNNNLQKAIGRACCILRFHQAVRALLLMSSLLRS